MTRDGARPESGGTAPAGWRRPPGGIAPAGCGRPLRRDAERNRQRILKAAAEVLAERGLQASLDDVARRAGVGVGTVYRRFPSKEALAEALFNERLSALVASAERALAVPDPWEGLVSYLEQAAELLAADRGLRQFLLFATFGEDQARRARGQLQPVVTKIFKRAQAAGAVRADVRPTDVPVMMLMIAAAADYAAPVRPGAWRRYLTLLLDGLPESRTGSARLPEQALSPAEVERAMHSGPAVRRPVPACPPDRPALTDPPRMTETDG